MSIIMRTPAEASAVSGAACGFDAERMFPLEESQRAGQEPTVGERRALAVCRRCPVLQRCREAVLEVALPHGVAGGLTAAQRRTVRAQRAGRADRPRRATVPVAGAVA